jgi:hypothetical protein
MIITAMTITITTPATSANVLTHLGLAGGGPGVPVPAESTRGSRSAMTGVLSISAACFGSL